MLVISETIKIISTKIWSFVSKGKSLNKVLEVSNFILRNICGAWRKQKIKKKKKMRARPVAIKGKSLNKVLEVINFILRNMRGEWRKNNNNKKG